MPMNAHRGPIELPENIPVFLLPGALLSRAGRCHYIFEPRYVAMVDDTLRDGHRLIGMIQPGRLRDPLASRPLQGRLCRPYYPARRKR